MAKSIRVITKKARGRPVTTGKGTLIGVRLQPSHLKALDAWIAQQDAPLTRPEAIRAMMETILILATIAQRFRFTVVPEHPVIAAPAFTLRPKHGIQAVLERR